MSQPASEQDIERLLAELKHSQVARRQAAAEEIAQRGIRDPRLDQVLEQMVRKDPSRAVADAATRALGRTPVAPSRFGGRFYKVYNTRREKLIDLAIGFIGWFIVNGILYVPVLLANTPQERSITAFTEAAVLFFANLIVLVLLPLIRRWLGLGALAAVAVNLLVTLILGMFFNATCGIPFFVNVGPSL